LNPRLRERWAALARAWQARRLLEQAQPARRDAATGLWRAPGRWRLSTRFAALSLVLLLAVQVLGFAAIAHHVERNARRTLADELAVAERVWGRLLEQRADKLSQGAALLAADFAFRDAVATQDDATIASVLDNHGARIGAAQVALLTPRYQPRSQSQGSAALGADTWAALAPTLAREGSVVAVVNGAAYQFVMVPMRAPVLVAWVLMGFELDHRVVDDLHAVTRHHATLVLQSPGLPPRSLHSSLTPALGATAATAVAASPAGAAQLALDGDVHLLRDLPLSGADSPADQPATASARVPASAAAAPPARVLLRLSGSLGQALAPMRALQWALAAVTLLGLLLFGLGSAWAARRVTQPLQALVQASNRLGRGDYDTPLAQTGRHDEFGDLAKAFEAMRCNIGAQQHEIRQLAFWDGLTGLPNRVQFRDAVQSAIEGGQPLAVLMLGLDRFKHVNDVLGRAMGDRMLQAVTQRLQQAVRPGDLVARLGGDQFAVLLPGAGAQQVQQLARRIASAFEAPLTLDDQRLDLSAGQGMACWPADAPDAETLLNRAEVAMGAAKTHVAGIQLYLPALDSRSAQTLSLLSELRQAVEHDELRLFLQPKVTLSAAGAGRLCGAEALVRWQHPTRGLVPPVQFIPFAEQTGWVRQLTLWVFEEAARQQASLLALGLKQVSINLSTRDLMDLELPDKLEALLLRHGARAEAFCLEITESAIMDDPARAETTLNRLSQRGYRLSIDDFGTGHSSLAYLSRLPVNELKIDRGFVMGMAGRDGGSGDTTIVRSTIELAHNLGLKVVAEGVETAALVQRLAEMGCDEAQGYHLGKPMPLAELRGWAGQWALALAAAGTTGAAAVQPGVQPRNPAIAASSPSKASA
jgi:diguanylate cyclase (GGDEF)-like protein